MQKYILPNLDTPSKLNEVPLKYATILKAEEWVNFVKHTATEEFKVLITHIYLTPYIFHNFVFSYTLKYLNTSSYYTSKRLNVLCCKARSAAAKMARAKCIYPHTMGRGGYAHVKEKMV